MSSPLTLVKDEFKLANKNLKKGGAEQMTHRSSGTKPSNKKNILEKSDSQALFFLMGAICSVNRRSGWYPESE